DDVEIGDDDAGRIDEESGAETVALGINRGRRELAFVKEAAELFGQIFQRGGLGGAGLDARLDADDRGQDALHDITIGSHPTRHGGDGLLWLSVQPGAGQGAAECEADYQGEKGEGPAFHMRFSCAQESSAARTLA